VLVEQRVREVQTGGISRNGEFTIRTCAESFEALSSGIYSDKIGAIIRELACNAWDSHVVAGNNNPFDVKLPNKLEPDFFVRDYGTGLSEDAIYELYTQYFFSDKRDSNELTGCLGLGSKSPFAYKDNFTVTSWYDGVKSVYSMHINEKGSPAVAKLGEAPSDEPSGLEVRFAVKYPHCNEFAEKAKDKLSWFKIRPNVTGIGNFSFQEIKLYYEGHGVGLNKEYESFLVMGNVKYPLSNIFSYNSLPGHYIESGIVIYAPIGSCDITTSRESLAKTPKTLKYIEDRVNDFDKKLSQELETQFSQCASLWDLKWEYYHFAHFRKIVGRIAGNVQWRGQKVPGPSISVDVDDVVYYIDKYERQKINKNGRFGSLSITPEYLPRKDAVYLNDMSQLGLRTAQQHMIAQNIDKAIFLSSFADVNRLVEAGVPFIRTSSLPPAERQKSVRTSRKADGKVWAHRFTNRSVYGTKRVSPWQYEQVDLTSLPPYLEMKEGKPQFLGNELYNTNDLVSQVMPTFYGVSQQYLSKVQKAGWPKLEDFLRDKRKTISLTDADYADYRSICDCLDVFGKPEFSQFVQQLSGDVRTLLDRVVVVGNMDDKDVEFIKLYNGLFNNPVDPSSLEQEILALSSKYKLVSFLSGEIYQPEMAKHVLKYMRFVDGE
jgi:hypothetical protein